MVVCYHFQRGSCRFGASCRFEHTNSNYDSYYNTNDSSQYQGDRYHYVKPTAATTQPAKNNQIDAGQIFDVVAADTMVAVNGGQWPFSSYGPVKGFQNIIGFEDISPEELRYLMYSAKESGNVDECKRHFNELLQMENMKRTLLMTPSVEADAAIQSIYRNEDQQPSNPDSAGAFQTSQPTLNRTTADSHSASIFGGSSLAAPFPASTNTASNPFATAGSANLFGGGAGGSVFGGGNSSSVFGGGGSPVQPGTGVYGGAPSGLFSAAAAAVTQQTSGGFFGSAGNQPAVPQQTSGGFFGSTIIQPAVPQQTSGGFFGSTIIQPTVSQQPPGGFFGSMANQPAVSQQTSGGFFGSTAPQPSSGLFAAAGSAFGEAATVGSSSIFGGTSAAQPNVFGTAGHTSSGFGSAQQASAFGGFQSSNEPFSKSNAPSSSFLQAGDVNGSAYTPLNDLDDEEKAAFQAKTFTIGNIPIRPPPRELCF